MGDHGHRLGRIVGCWIFNWTAELLQNASSCQITMPDDARSARRCQTMPARRCQTGIERWCWSFMLDLCWWCWRWLMTDDHDIDHRWQMIWLMMDRMVDCSHSLMTSNNSWYSWWLMVTHDGRPHDRWLFSCSHLTGQIILTYSRQLMAIGNVINIDITTPVRQIADSSELAANSSE